MLTAHAQLTDAVLAASTDDGSLVGILIAILIVLAIIVCIVWLVRAIR